MFFCFFFFPFFLIISNLYIYHAINYKLFLNIDDIDGMFFVFFLFLFHLLLVTYRYIFYHAIHYKLFLNIGDTDGDIFYLFIIGN